MKKYLFIIIINLSILSLNAQDSLSYKYFNNGTAFTMPKHRFELGILDESSYGLKDDLQISSPHLIVCFLLPNFQIKKYWGSYHGFYFASKHGIFYPSIFMRTVATKGTGGLISPEYKIPDMLAINNQMLVSYIPFKKAILTINAGFKFAINSGELNPQSTIDFPIFYPRLAVFYNQPELDAGIDFRGTIIRRLGWQLSVDNFWFSNTDFNYFMEHNLGLTYISKKQTCKIELGYKLCYGKYVPGDQWHLLPLAGFVFKL